MPFGEKTGRSAFFAVLGQEVVRLDTIPTTFKNPVCIGKAAEIRSHDGLIAHADFYVTPDGGVAFVLPDLAPDDLELLNRCAAAVRTWTAEDLDEIASDYFYKTEGQAALVIDVMAGIGFLNFAQRPPFYAAVNKTLASGDFLVATAEPPFYPVRCSRRHFIREFSDLYGLDPDEMTGFICELESVHGVAAVVRNNDLVVLYSPPGEAPPYPLFYFTVANKRADLCVSPRTLRHSLDRCGVPLSAADSLFEFFARFADKNRTRPSPEDGSVSLLYLDPVVLFQEAPSLAEKIVQFSHSIPS